MKKRSWTDINLRNAVRNSFSIRQVLKKLGLVPAGGNYVHISRRIKELSLDTSHFTGKLWSKGKTVPKKPLYSLDEILVRNSQFQSYKLKKRLFRDGIKSEACEMCGWAHMAPDGRIPLELDHINGNRTDNRLSNLRVLCPNCHSVQPTHRGKNKRSRGGEIGSHV